MLLKQLLLYPYRHRFPKRIETPRSEPNIGFQQTFKFQERLIVKGNVIDFGKIAAGFGETVTDSVTRETAIVLSSREAFFLRCGDDMPIFDQRGCAIVIKSRNAENPQGKLALG